MPLKNLYAGV